MHPKSISGTNTVKGLIVKKTCEQATNTNLKIYYILDCELALIVLVELIIDKAFLGVLQVSCTVIDFSPVAEMQSQESS